MAIAGQDLVPLDAQAMRQSLGPGYRIGWWVLNLQPLSGEDPSFGVKNFSCSGGHGGRLVIGRIIAS